MRVVYHHIVLHYQSLHDTVAYTFKRVGPYINREARYISTPTLTEMIQELRTHGYLKDTPPDANV
jgi:hypothetical protein